MADHNLTTTAVVAGTTTIDDLRDRLRIELRDEDEGAYRWPDETLDRHLQRAVRDLSLVAPRERASTLSTTDGSRDLSLGPLPGLITIMAVEYPTGLYPPRFVQFSAFAGTLSLLIDQLPGASENVGVYWGQLHTLDAVTSTLKAAHEDIVILGAGGYAALEWANFSVNRANLSGDDAYRHYHEWGSATLERFRQQLNGLRENSRLRTGQVFAPGSSEAGRHIVRWEP